MMILDKKGLGAVKKQTSLRVALLQMVLIPALGVIIILVGVFIISAYITQSQIIQGQQNLINILAQQSNQYLIETRQLLITLASSMLDLDSKIQQKLLSQARANYPRFTAIYLLDNTGRVIAESTESLSLMNLDMTGEAFYRHAQSSKDVFFSDPFISPSTGHVSVTGVIPIYAEDQFNGVLVGELNLDSLQQVIEPIKSGEGSSVFIVDQRGTLIAHPIAEWVQQQRDVGNLPLVQDGLAGETNVFKVFYDNDQKAWLIGSLTPMPNNWLVVITQPAIIAARPLIGLITISGLVLLLTLVIFVITQTYSLRRITQPISALVEKANRLAGGDYKILSDPQQSSGFKEITSLEQSFTRMVEAVQERDHQLEQRVIERTQRLELIATLGEQLSAILDLDKLLTTMVNQVQQNFGYYHVHIYLLDDKNENLVVIEGTGNAGAEMKARGHHIALNTPTSLVAQAARNKQIVWVDNVRESPDWLPNPLLPDTQTEMAVPIIIEGKVVGVLDVQGDEVAGLDEADAGLLRSLANQVAVAIRNSRLFAQVETALAEIRATQERYLSQVWQKSQAVSLTPQHLYTQPGAAVLSPTIMAQAKQQALTQPQPAIVTLGKDGSSLVAPVSLAGKPIGAFQLHQLGANSQASPWTEEDLALVETILDQVAQTAENIRLFEETRERAGREQTIREITDKLRAASSLEKLIKTTAEELGRHFSADLALVEFGIDKANKPVVVSSNGNVELRND